MQKLIEAIQSDSSDRTIEAAIRKHKVQGIQDAEEICRAIKENRPALWTKIKWDLAGAWFGISGQHIDSIVDNSYAGGVEGGAK